VTGASSGIGAELARQFASVGARVGLVARNGARLNAVAAECRVLGGDALVIEADVGIEASCRDAVARAVEHFGVLDVLVNNAGIGFRGRFDEIMDLSMVERLMRVNYFGSAWCTAYALPHLKQSRGRIVAISSLSGLAGVPRRSIYCATKHAMAGFFDALRVELEDDGVSVTMIYPSFVYSAFNEHGYAPDGAPYGQRGHKRAKSESMSIEECCRQVLRATERRDRDLLMTWRAKVE
jgi:NAD(P)-dependent dehydrogenase (short-subunit alcohol dehydrogenase family)